MKGPLLWVVDIDVDVPPYPRVNYRQRDDGRWEAGNWSAKRRMDNFYAEVASLVAFTRQRPIEPIAEPIEVEMAIFKRRGGSGDASNLLRSVEDAMGVHRGVEKSAPRAGVWLDDGQIRRVEARVLAPYRPRLVVAIYHALAASEAQASFDAWVDGLRRERSGVSV